MDDMVVRALHAARQHFDEGGFLDSLRGMFSGPDYQSNGKEASFANMPTQDETNADFFKADRAARLAREVMAQQPQADTRPVIPERAVEQAPALTVPGPTQLRVNLNPSPAMKALLTQADGSSIPDNAMALAPDKLADRAAPEAIKIADRAAPDQSAADAVWARMLRQESGNRQFDRNGRTITSPVGALGISQVMPSTGPEAARLAGLPWSLDRLRNDPEYNEALGRAYFDTQLARFGDPALAAAAYNGGPGRVAQALRQAQATGRPYTDFLRPETQNYVRVVGRAEGGEVEAPDEVNQALDVVKRQPMTPAALARAWTPPEEAIATDVGPRASEFMQNYPEKLGAAMAAMPGEMLETAKLPGEVMSGERSFDPHSDEDIRKAMDLAMMAQTGGIGGASARAGETVLGASPVRHGAINETADIAHQIANLLKNNEAKKITDEMLAKADPQTLWKLYESGATGMKMPMDYESRMDRAKSMGYDQKAYRGIRGEEVNDYKLNTDRPEGKMQETGSWLSSDPDVAATYTGNRSESPATLPVFIQSKEMKTVPWKNEVWSYGPKGKSTDEVGRAIRNVGAKGVNFTDIVDVGPHLWNQADVQKRLPETSTTTMIADPSTVRSQFAIFDPRLSHLTHLNRRDGGSVEDRALMLVSKQA